MTPSGARTTPALHLPSDWIAEITEAWARGGTHTLELARLVLTARKRMCYGEWTQLWKSGEMPFSKRKGEMLIVIGERLGKIDTQLFAHLPTGWSILYWLARLDQETLQKLVAQGTVHPKLRLQDAKRLAIKPWSRPGKRPSRKADVTRWLRQSRHFVERTLSQWKPEDRKQAQKELTSLIEEIGAATACLPNAMGNTGPTATVQSEPAHSGSCTVESNSQPRVAPTRRREALWRSRELGEGGSTDA